MPPSADILRFRRKAGTSIAILAEPRDGHAVALRRAFRSRGADARIMSFADFSFDSSAQQGISCHGGLPRAVFVRTIPGGAFEAVTRRLGLLHGLSAIGLKVWNTAKAIERCVDKSMTSFLLGLHDVPTPATWAVESVDAARRICELEAGPLVLKPLFGSQGRGIRLIESPDDLPPPETLGGVYYLQRFAGNGSGGFHDYRVLVSGGRALAAMRRRGQGWITNVKRGGAPEHVALSEDFTRLALAAARAVGADFCGVDIIVPPDSPPLVLEVNSMPAWSGLQKVTSFRIADAIAADFLDAGHSGLAL